MKILKVYAIWCPSMCLTTFLFPLNTTDIYKEYQKPPIGWQPLIYLFFIYFKEDFIYFERKGREGEREGEKHWCATETSINCLSHSPNRGPGPQPRHVPWLRIKLAVFWFAGQSSIHWATPATEWFKHFTYII